MKTVSHNHVSIGPRRSGSYCGEGAMPTMTLEAFLQWRPAWDEIPAGIRSDEFDTVKAAFRSGATTWIAGSGITLDVMGED